MLDKDLLSDTQIQRLQHKKELKGFFTFAYQGLKYPYLLNSEFFKNQTEFINFCDNKISEFIDLCVNRLQAREHEINNKSLNDFINGGDIVINELDFGTFENIKNNLYYALSDYDLMRNYILPIPTFLLFISGDKKIIDKNIKDFAKIESEKEFDFCKYLKRNFIQIPPTDYKANTQLLKLLYKTNKFKPIIVNVVREFMFVYTSLLRENAKNETKDNLSFYTQFERKKDFSDDLIKWNFKNNFLPCRLIRQCKGFKDKFIFSPSTNFNDLLNETLIKKLKIDGTFYKALYLTHTNHFIQEFSKNLHI
ncbi:MULTISPECIES: hypothetical protein [unclassified Campylobacter]|uniref:hypothetical protein n=1 Tax=unclassified Campylobacter TaxID=2593542 RepID=UPI0022E9D918|nr:MULTISPECIES: hypothetical protein [unclassified Campylobacter]MDA3062838.1 hypothetical protein [Campylobacter sp. JMF_14 EL1]MDA3073732.1 hypothetical protein [Campylobacter sp. JMF_10 EL2]